MEFKNSLIHSFFFQLKIFTILLFYTLNTNSDMENTNLV